MPVAGNLGWNFSPENTPVFKDSGPSFTLYRPRSPKITYIYQKHIESFIMQQV